MAQMNNIDVRAAAKKCSELNRGNLLVWLSEVKSQMT